MTRKPRQGFTVSAQKRGKDGRVIHYISAPNGSLLHADYGGAYPLMAALLKKGWKKVVMVSLEQCDGIWVQVGTMTLTPSTKQSRADAAARADENAT